MNTVCLVGRLVRDVEFKMLPSQKKICSGKIAISRDKENADFINFVAFNTVAETLDLYTKKGYKVGLEGRISSRNYEDKDGRKHDIIEVVVNRVELLERRDNGDKAEQPIEVQQKIDTRTMNTIDEDLPF